MTTCMVCERATATVECGAACGALYCGENCARADWTREHALACGCSELFAQDAAKVLDLVACRHTAWYQQRADLQNRAALAREKARTRASKKTCDGGLEERKQATKTKAKAKTKTKTKAGKPKPAPISLPDAPGADVGSDSENLATLRATAAELSDSLGDLAGIAGPAAGILP